MPSEITSRPSPTLSARSRWSPPFLLFILLSVIAAASWRWMQSYPVPLFDLYPLYYGGQAWLATGNAYDLASAVPLDQQGSSIYLIGNSYPLPAILLVLPLTFLPTQVAATIWVGLLAGGLILALRLIDAPFWLLLYLPVIEGLRIEQYSILMLIFQIVALWAYRERKPWLLACCCAIILTKPSNGGLFVLLLLFWNRRWREPLIAIGLLWGLSLLVDYNWVAEWLMTVSTYVGAAPQIYLWPLLILVLPLLFWRDLLTATLLTQLTIMPQPVLYSASMLYLGQLDERRPYAIIVCAMLWPALAILAGKEIATAVAFIAPVLVSSYLRRRRSARPT